MNQPRYDQRLRVGVVGCGYWGPKHLRVLAGLSTVESVVAIDVNVMRLAEMRRILPAVECYTDLDEALPRIDALVVATPPSSHLSFALRAIAAGKHVLIEKPMATSAVDAALLVESARDAGCILMAGHTFEYNPAVLKLRDIVQSGVLGSVYYIDSARLNLGLYQSDVDVLFDLAPHDVSITNFVLDAQPTAVEAWASRHAHPRHADVAYLRMRYENPNVSATIHVSWLDPCKVRRLTVVGSRKMAVYDDLNSDERIRVYDKGVVADVSGDPTSNVGQPPMSYRYGDIVAPYMPSSEPLEVQDAHFIDSILCGTSPKSDGRVGLAVVQVLEAARLSMFHGGEVAVSDVLPGELVGAGQRNSARDEIERKLA